MREGSVILISNYSILSFRLAYSAQWSRSIGEGVGWAVLGLEGWFFACGDIFASLEHSWTQICTFVLSFGQNGDFAQNDAKNSSNGSWKTVKNWKIASRKRQISQNAHKCGLFWILEVKIDIFCQLFCKMAFHGKSWQIVVNSSQS